MMRLPANRAAVAAARRQLEAYQKARPALDRRHRTLAAARLAEARALAALEAAHARALENLAQAFPMLATVPLEAKGRLRAQPPAGPPRQVAGVPQVGAGVAAPVHSAPARLGEPPWVAALDHALAQAATQRLEIAARRASLGRLEQAARRAAQRLNLVEKVLIPHTEAEIRRMLWRLADRRRAAVVAARIAKRQAGRAFAATTPMGEGGP
ncbi:MAG: hypothetical protein NZM40_06640 [Sphingomonadaceae bacterium]|uniref:V-type ATP synthase subunit D n=1 Tax=Thermaurantiacus sp. TaxID=2820283 RepID=UPI00298F1F7F|nr:V-type ATP synthase subunit D [Thermaurantiacus sp.]MCS6987094.1 hypothetical protein [Sphingomonadaceae bacterium]MDW8415568.1 V-type ATP synthase subunit D [Thermaurantiacus sp.]